MVNDLVINSDQNEAVIALLEDKKLVELHREASNSSYAVGDLYLGRVKRTVPGLNAAFVDVGYERDAFLHYLDLGPQFRSLKRYLERVRSGKMNSASLDKFKNEPDIEKTGKITEVISANMPILVQVAKEPISTKGPRITCELTLPGRYIVLVPFSDRISLSQKIRDAKERKRLKRLISSIRPANFGVIVRTVAENKMVAELDQDLRDLVQKWDECFEALLKAKPPTRVLGELDRTSVILRDVLNSNFRNIHVNSAKLAEDVKGYLRNIDPEKEKMVKFYEGKRGIFDHFGIEKQIKGLFGKHVTMKSGAYLVVEHTEALHVIDVNSGNTARSRDDQETNALRVNLEAAEEIAQQLRLRDMGGIIVIDFIDMQKSENKRKLYDSMVNSMNQDRAKHHVLPPSKFGLIQITRQRVRPELDIKTAEKCPTCNGTGEVQATLLVFDQIENNLKYILTEQNETGITLRVHPFLGAYIKQGFPSKQQQWFMKYKTWVKVESVTSFHLLDVRFFNRHKDEISL